MDNKYKKNNFLDYINNPMSKESIILLYNANNIRFEKCELYSDFVQSLLHLIFDTYLGDDVTNLDQQVKHFNWCWSKNIKNFNDEGIDFSDIKLYDYFLEFMLEVFYSSLEKQKTEYINKNLLKLWNNILDFNRIKTNADMDTLIEIYNIFEKSLKKA